LGSGATRPPKATSTAELVQRNTSEAHGELAWRFGLLLAAANMLLLGLGLAASNPRRPSNLSLVFALLAFVVYYFNLVNLSQVWVAAGRASLVGALLGIHGAVLALSLTLLWWRDHAAVLRFGRSKAAAT
jgi:lipopolysaccharide export system permease protein